MKTMAEVLDEHHDWAWSLEQGEVLCVGCDWSKKLRDIDPAAVAFRAHQADALAAAGYGPVKAATILIRDLTDPDDCSFDHHGGCQAHGYLDLEIGEMCPQLEAKAWAHNHAANLDAP